MNMLDVQSAAEILTAAQSGLKVKRLIDDYVFEGTARSIGNADGTFGRSDADIRTLYLRVTGSYTEHYWLVSELITDHQATTFVVDRY
jgi:hypothetical protein